MDVIVCPVCHRHTAVGQKRVVAIHDDGISEQCVMAGRRMPPNYKKWSVRNRGAN